VGCTLQQGLLRLDGAQRQEVLFVLQLTTFFRIFTAIPIEIVLGALTGSGAGLLFFAPLLMILFRKKYPARWFKWNLEFLRFNNRINIYLALMDDHYPSTTEQQSVHLDCPYPDMGMGLNRWLPLVKWFLAIPHYVILFFLGSRYVWQSSSPGLPSCSPGITRKGSSILSKVSCAGRTG
jgi:hypothetical protein